VVLNNCDAPNAFLRAEAIRVAMASLPVHTAEGPLSVTMSLGVLYTPEFGCIPVEDILREVDVALYAAKGAGRNCSKITGGELLFMTGRTIRPGLEDGK